MAARSASRSSSSSSCTLVDLVDVDDDAQNVFEDVVIDLTDDYSSSLLRDGELALDRLQARGATWRPGDVVEVRGAHLGSYAVDFLKIKIIAETRSGEHVIRGDPLVRTRALLEKLLNKKNEVCWLHFIEDAGPIYLDISPQSIVRRRSLIITNAPYPEHSLWSLATHIDNGIGHGHGTRQEHDAEHFGPLACRWRLTIYFERKGRQMRPVEEALESMPSTDVPDSRYHMPYEALRNRWHGAIIAGGSWNAGRAAHVDLEAASQAPRTRSHGQKYTFFDAFSGAGGASRGAQGAGFKVQYAVDKSPEVWETYRGNFPQARLFKTCTHGFLTQTHGENIRVDVLHLSPPCQFFSPAHTHDSVHDADNIAALFGCGELIKKTRPRIITLEQTFGITHDRHIRYFRALIGQMTQHGYSVRWRVVRLCTWGSAQDRKRLVVIAASPGHRLPPFPAATHSETGGGGRKPFTTISQAIDGIPRGHDLHQVWRVHHFEPPRAPLDPHQLARTITTGGAELYHPSGTRKVTLRELASLQGFPLHHRFVGNDTSIRKQIGNAFPPNTVDVLYRHLQRWLLQEDGIVPLRPNVAQVLIVDDD